MPSEDKTPATPAAKPPRTRSAIVHDLEAARARFRELHPRVEQMTAKINKQNARIEQKKNKWRVDFPDEPFDPYHYEPPMIPIKQDDELQEEFYALHYVIAGFEDELAALTKATVAVRTEAR